jgi:hypothetical protein
VLQVGSLQLQAFNLSKGIAQRFGCLAVQIGIGSETINLGEGLVQRVGCLAM